VITIPWWAPALTALAGLATGLVLARRDPDDIARTLRAQRDDARRAAHQSATAYARHLRDCDRRRADAIRDAYAEHLKYCPLTTDHGDAA